MPRFSLRLKLTLWFFFVFSAIQITLAVAAMLVRADLIREQFDQRLHDRTLELANDLRFLRQPWTSSQLKELAAQVSHGVFFGPFVIQLRNGEGKLAASSGGHVAEIPLNVDLERIQADQVVLEFLPSNESARIFNRDSVHRLITLPFRDRVDQTWILQAATTDRYLQEVLAFLRGFFLTTVPLGLVAAGVAGWMIAGMATRPIMKAAVATSELSATTLGKSIQFDVTHEEFFQLQRELNDARRRLEEAFSAYEQFIGDVAHELKTPISVLLAESQAITCKPANAKQYKQYIASVEEEMRRLGKLIESFLTLARVGHGRALVENIRVSVNDVVLEAVQHCEPYARQFKVRLIPQLESSEIGDSELVVDGDPALLQTMVSNLLRNAIRFSPNGESVNVEVSKRNSSACITVRDKGPGIPAEYKDKVFDRFVQVPNSDLSSESTGLGLTIVRHIAELHRGNVQMESGQNVGCTFLIHIPLGSQSGSSSES